jgi:hypothetical protein
MKTRYAMVVLLSITVLGACSSPLEDYGMRGGRGQGYRLCPYECSVPATVACRSGVVTGQITRISIEEFAEDMEPGVAFNLVDADGSPVHVHVGPLWFMEKRESDFKVGDRVTVEGVCYHKDGKHYLIAARMIHGDHTLILRDTQGRPAWVARPRPSAP